MEVRREGRWRRGDPAREGRLAPERQRWRLQPRTICTLAEALNQPGNAASPGNPERGAQARERPLGWHWRRSLPAAPDKRGEDIPYWSLTLGTAFPPTDGGNGKVNDSDFIFFLPQPQGTKQTWSVHRQSQSPAFAPPCL